LGEKHFWREAMSKFIRLNITAEGQTEEQFVRKTLADHLGYFNISANVRCVLTSKDRYRTYRGGLLNYDKAKKDIVTWLKEDGNADARFTTMFDLYALPSNFPEYEESKKINDPYKRIEFLESSFKSDIKDPRFIPYLQLYEFESLLFTDPEALGIEYFEFDDAIKKLKEISDRTGNPELINDNPESAPSKRIIKLIPPYEYNKPAIGAMTAGLIGINQLKKGCKHFNDWIAKLEALSS
jgi:hypothetical protein